MPEDQDKYFNKQINNKFAKYLNLKLIFNEFGEKEFIDLCQQISENPIFEAIWEKQDHKILECVNLLKLVLMVHNGKIELGMEKLEQFTEKYVQSSYIINLAIAMKLFENAKSLTIQQ